MVLGVVFIKKICYIIGACKENSENIIFSCKENDIIIAADGGYDLLVKKEIVPDIIVGDFDSVITDLPCQNVIKYPVEKDDTDTLLACKIGIEKNYNNFVIFGGVGGRIDHTFANVQSLLWVAKRGGRAFLIGSDVVMTVISNDKLSFSKERNGKISVFAISTYV